MSKQGAIFEYETARSLRRCQDQLKKFMWYRIPDTQVLRFASANTNVLTNTVPSDFMSISNGVPFMIECKSSRNHSSYCLGYIREHQIKDMCEVEACGGRAWFLMNRRKRKKGSDQEPLEVIAVKPQKIREYVESGMKSVKWKDMDGLQITRDDTDKGIAWNLAPLFRR